MQIVREPQFISGFYFDAPVDRIPALTHCGEALFCRGYGMQAHHHSGFEFLYLSRGSASWQTSGEKFAIGTIPTVLHDTTHWPSGGQTFRQAMGDLFIAHPGEAHRTGPRNNPENQHTWLGLDLDRLGRPGVTLASELRKGSTHLLPACQEIESLLHAIIAQMPTMRPQRDATVRSLLNSFMMLVLQRLESDRLPPETGHLSPLLPYSTSVRRVITYMRQNLDRRIPLEDFAAVATARSVPHFCSRFRHEVGVTPAAYHSHLRLEAAREALQQPSMNITNAAMHHGFSSSQHFSTQFRKAYRTTPRHWVEKIRRKSAGNATTRA